MILPKEYTPYLCELKCSNNATLLIEIKYFLLNFKITCFENTKYRTKYLATKLYTMRAIGVGFSGLEPHLVLTASLLSQSSICHILSPTVPVLDMSLRVIGYVLDIDSHEGYYLLEVSPKLIVVSSR